MFPSTSSEGNRCHRSREGVKLSVKCPRRTAAYPGMDGAHAEPCGAVSSWKIPATLEEKRVKSNRFNLPVPAERRQSSAPGGGLVAL